MRTPYETISRSYSGRRRVGADGLLKRTYFETFVLAAFPCRCPLFLFFVLPRNGWRTPLRGDVFPKGGHDYPAAPPLWRMPFGYPPLHWALGRVGTRGKSATGAAGSIRWREPSWRPTPGWQKPAVPGRRRCCCWWRRGLPRRSARAGAGQRKAACAPTPAGCSPARAGRRRRG